jgi:hypothetical protein
MKEKNSQHWASDPEKVEAFVLHRIDESERVSCTAHLNQCEECRRVVQEERELVAGIRYVGRNEMKLRLKQWIQRRQGKRFDWTQAASLAAAIILMLGAVFTIRWFTDFNQSKTRSHEIVLKSDDSSQRSIWIIGKVVEQKRVFRGTISENNSSFIIKQGNVTQTVSIRSALTTELPLTMRTYDESNLQTLFVRTSNGLQLTIYSIAASNSATIGIEAVTGDSLIVYFRGQQIAYHIPGGWAGKM